MTAERTLLWAIAVMMVAVLNIIEVLPDWTAIAAVLTTPFVVGTRCRPARGGSR